MTASIESHSEFIHLQSELRRAIYQHHVILNKINRDSSDHLHNELDTYQKRIRHLCERQKIIFHNLRKSIANGPDLPFKLVRKKPFPPGALPSTENDKQSKVIKKTVLHTDRNLALPQQALAVRTPAGQTKLLIPVSSNVAANKKGNQQQIVVIPTSTNGTRITTSSTIISANMTNSAMASKPLGIKSFVVDTNSTAAGTSINLSALNSRTSPKIIVPTISYGQSLLSQTSPKSTLIIKQGSGSSSPSNGTSSTCSQSAASGNKSIKTTVPIIMHSEVVDPMLILKSKEDFFAALGLVTKKALKDIQNKKGERKRRTTANPHFSNAAIEAKRISAMELAAKKAKRREMLLAANKSSSPTSSRVAAAASAATNTTTTTNTTTSSNTANNNTNTNNKRVFLSSTRSKVSSQSNTSTTASGLHAAKSVEAKRATGVSRSSTNPKRTLSTITPIIAAAAPTTNGVKLSRNCTVCDELCEFENDTVVNCRDCRCVFHATCASTVDQISKSMTVPCPKCGIKLSLDEDSNSTSATSVTTTTNDRLMVVDEEMLNNNHINTTTTTTNDVDLDDLDDAAAMNRSSRASSTTGGRRKNKNSKSSKQKQSLLNCQQSKSEDIQKEEERKNLLLKQINLNKKLRDCKKRTRELNALLQKEKSHGLDVTRKRDKTQKSLDKLIGFVRNIQQNVEHKENVSKCSQLTNGGNHVGMLMVVPSSPTSSPSTVPINNGMMIETVQIITSPVDNLCPPVVHPIISEAGSSSPDASRVDFVESLIRCEESGIPEKRPKFDDDEDDDDDDDDEDNNRLLIMEQIQEEVEEEEEGSGKNRVHDSLDEITSVDETSAAVASIQIDL